KFHVLVNRSFSANNWFVRDFYRKYTSFIFFAFYAYFALVQFNKLFYNSQAQARSAQFSGYIQTGLRKTLEYIIYSIRRDSYPSIFDLKNHFYKRRIITDSTYR